MFLLILMIQCITTTCRGRRHRGASKRPKASGRVSHPCSFQNGALITISSPISIRTLGGVSALALTAGFSSVAVAQTAPAPVTSVPTPVTPAAPGNTEECVFDAMAAPPTVVCGPGTDPDGITQGTAGIEANVDAGSQVQGEIALGDNANVTVDGAVVVTTLDRAISVGQGSEITINGFVESNASLMDLSARVRIRP